jgi:hypothetical protein
MLLAEWPTLEGREEGEALRRLFRTVELLCERTRQTGRPGRYRHTLRRDRTGWAFAASDLDASSSRTARRPVDE